MTDEEYIQYLDHHDDHSNWEYPPDMDYEKNISRFNEFVSELESNGLKCCSDSQGQDASFHSVVSFGETTLVFSNFGNMIAIYDDETISPKNLKIVQELAEKLGYVYIPSKFLMRAYKPKGIQIDCIKDWWTRFFCYL